ISLKSSVASTSRQVLRTSLLVVGIAFGVGLLFTYFFGFFIGLAVAVCTGIVFAFRSVRRSTNVRRISIIIGLMVGMLILTYVFGLYGGIIYIVAILVI